MSVGGHPNDLVVTARPHGETPAIALDDVYKRFGAVVAVAGVSMAIGRGEFFAVLGPSGCGKTTVLRLIAGFEDISSGRIRLDGIDVAGVPPYRRNVNTVFQHYALFPHLSVFDNVAFGPRATGVVRAEAEQRVAATLDIVRLGDLAGRRPDQLSGGQRQRVALARALVNNPSALLLDEPLSALDRALRQAMQRELKRIQRETGIAFVFVTHDQEEALTMSDRIAVMRDGSVEQVGTPAEIYQMPASIFVAEFIGSANLIAVVVEAVHGDRATVRLPGDRRADVVIGAAGAQPGGDAVIMVRPERIRVAASPPSDASPAIAVTMTEIVFQGPTVRCVLRDADGGELVAQLDASGGAGLARGAALWASWEIDAARLLPLVDRAGGARSDD